MAVETLPGSACPARGRPQWTQRLRRQIAARLRLLRRAHSRRTRLARVLAEISDPRLVAEAGFRPPGPGALERWAQLWLQHGGHAR